MELLLGLATVFVAMCWVMTWEWLTSNGPRLTAERGWRGLSLRSLARNR